MGKWGFVEKEKKKSAIRMTIEIDEMCSSLALEVEVAEAAVALCI